MRHELGLLIVGALLAGWVMRPRDHLAERVAALESQAAAIEEQAVVRVGGVVDRLDRIRAQLP